MIEDSAEQMLGRYLWTIKSGLESISGVGEHWQDKDADIQLLIRDIELRDNCHSAVLYRYELKNDFTIRPVEVKRIDLKEGSGVLWEMKNKNS